MHNEKLGVAIFGAGNVARAHAASWMKNPRAEIVSVGSRRRETAQRLIDEIGLACPATDDFDALLADPRVEVLNLSGPNHVHAPQGIAAAEAGKHILVEKPMAITMDENRALRDAVQRAGVRSIVSFCLRWNPLFVNVKSLLAAGAIGDMFHAEVDYWHGIGPWYHGQAWAVPAKTGGSAMLLAGCHGVDALRWFVGDDVVEVAAVSNNKLGFFEYDANVTAVMKFRGGVTGKTSVLLDCRMPYTFNIDLIGTEGALRDNRMWSKKLLPGQTGWATLPTVMPDSADVHHHPFDAQIDEFVDCIFEGRESHCNVADAYKTHELCLAIDRSIAEGGRPVRLPLE